MVEIEIEGVRSNALRGTSDDPRNTTLEEGLRTLLPGDDDKGVHHALVLRSQRRLVPSASLCEEEIERHRGGRNSRGFDLLELPSAVAS